LWDEFWNTFYLVICKDSLSTLNSPVTGNVVQSKHVGRDIMAGLKTLVGGEIKSYTEMLTEARHIAISRLVEEALKLDVDALVNLRFTTSSIMSGSSEILAYGTAVKLKP
jgi:uncharacterized protein YbjQ (UPF0145 family)